MYNVNSNLSLADAPFYGSAYSGVPGSEIMKTLNEEQKDMISYYIMGVSTISICCAGAVVNMLSLVVLTRRSVGTPTTSAYLISLAAADLLVLFATILTAIKDARRPVRDQLLMLLWQDVQFIPGAYPYFHATAILFQVTSVWLTVAFTSDRYLMICYPFVAKRWCTVRFAKCTILCIYVCSIIYGIPRYFEYHKFEMDLPPGVEIYGGFTRVANLSELVTSENFSVQKFVWYDLTEFGRSDRFRITYHLWSWNILVVGLPFVTIAFMNSFLIREVRRSSLRGLKQGQQRETRRHETDVMLIGVIVIFFVCQLPAAISHISWGVIPPKDTQKMFWFLLNEIGNLLIVVNSAINLVPYYMFSRRFRRHFIQIFCSYRLVRDDGWHCVHVPRWVAENMAKDASDNYASGGNAVYQRRYSIRLTNCHRNAGSNPNIRRSLADNLTVRSNSRNSAIRLERGRRRSQRLSSGLSRLPQNFSQSEKESLPNLRESETINNHACDLEAEKEIARRSTTVHVNFHMQPTPNIMTTNTVL